MEVSYQQQEILDTQGNISINGIAGSGKTTILPLYFQANSKKKILYLVPNKFIMKKAKALYRDLGLNKVRVETPYTLAWKRIGHKKISVRDHEYSPFEIKKILNLDTIDPIQDLKIANYVGKLLKCYCNSKAIKLSELNFEKSLFDSNELQYYWKNAETIWLHTSTLIKKISEGEIPCYHEYYLKLYLLTEPNLQSELILLDNGHDVSPCIYEVFNNQNAIKVVMGDEHQQYRQNDFFINSLHLNNFKSLNLEKSFRYNQIIANQVRWVLARKKKLFENFEAPVITGIGPSEMTGNHAVIGRTKSGLLSKAIDQVFIQNEVDDFYFEGEFKDYYTHRNGANVNDIQALYLKENARIRDPFIRSLKSFTNLEEYVARVGDPEYEGLMNLVKEFGKDLPTIIRKIKKRIGPINEQKHKNLIYSTLSFAREKTYDEVTLLNDFMGIRKDIKEEVDIDYAFLEKEFNLLYTASSKAKVKLNNLTDTDDDSPDHPINYEEVILPFINKIDLSDKNTKADQIEDIYTLRRIKNHHRQIYEKWTPESDEKLALLNENRKSIEDIAANFQRTKASIAMRLKKISDENEEE